MSFIFADHYPHTEWFVSSERGWIEIGVDEYSPSFIRALDIGGMIWEGERSYDSLDDALADLERGISQWRKENYR